MGKQPTPTITPPLLEEEEQQQQEVMDLLGQILQEGNETDDEGKKATESSSSLISMGLAGAFVVAHGAILFSLPPVLRGKGAPFLPTKSTTMDRMFTLIRKQPQIQKKLQLQKHEKLSASLNMAAAPKGMTFMDLGSGDGRMVFRAAKETATSNHGPQQQATMAQPLFRYSVGYEINPVLHMFAQARRIVQFPSFYSNTLFYRKDLWKVNLSNVDVIAVYGLHPIMDRLGKKMQAEASPGTIIVSNVFSIPGWKPICVEKGVFIYAIPDSL